MVLHRALLVWYLRGHLSLSWSTPTPKKSEGERIHVSFCPAAELGRSCLILWGREHDAPPPTASRNVLCPFNLH